MPFGNEKLITEHSVGVVCHDAGGANLVFSILAHHKPNNLKVYVEGPAIEIFKNFFPDLQQEKDLGSALYGIEVLVSGTGWASNLEHDARRLAMSRGIRNVAVIDHWINYKVRFFRNGELIKPDQIWVSDPFAFKIAQKQFPEISIRQIRNYYLDELIANIGCPPVGNSMEVLYILEPARSNWGKAILGEFQALEYFLSKLDKLQLSSDVVIKLRPHPSDEIGKYDAWIAKTKNSALILEKKTSLQNAISRSHIVVGCESFALVVALMAGKDVYCSLPPWAPACRLPHDGLIHLKNWG